jgi:transposase
MTTLHLDACHVDTTAAQITLRVRSMQTSVPCPLCAIPTRRIHSHYERTLADLPWAHYRVRLQLRVRKWVCRHRPCPRRILALNERNCHTVPVGLNSAVRGYFRTSYTVHSQ